MNIETTSAQIVQHYKAMLDSVNLINAIVAGTQMSNDSAVSKTSCIKRNVEHLELMLAKDFWTIEDMAPVTAAIAAGNGYVS